MKELKGYRIWEIDDKTRVPKEIESGSTYQGYTECIGMLDLENKTYAIRVGKTGLK